MRRCPTEAIRVRGGKAIVNYDRCIACGECVRVCVYRAKKAVYDKFDDIHKFKYKIALPAPALYGQFNNLTDINYVLAGLLAIGFDGVYEVARGAELASEATRNVLKDAAVTPIISTACPAVIELILLRFHNLKDNLLDVLAPIDIAARLAREKAMKETGLKKEDIGIFFISPCSAKVYAVKNNIGLKESDVDGVLSISEVYFKLLEKMNHLKDPAELSKTGILGLSWGTSGGEAAGTLKDRYLAADGVENVMNILKELEDDKLLNVDFIELNACIGGCVGGVLNIENPFVARTKINSLRKYRPLSKNSLEEEGKPLDFYRLEAPYELQDALKLDADRSRAMRKLRDQERVYNKLPHIDCGMCGAPSCTAFSEDVATGKQRIKNCVNYVKETKKKGRKK
jgi:Fe-S-cluster-containing hydrogenase component 2